MSIGILSKFATLQPITDAVRTDALQRKLVAFDRHQLDGLYVAGDGAGAALLLPDNETGEPAVLELVPSVEGKDSVATLYKAHPIVNDRQTYLNHRREVIDCLNDIAEAEEGTTATIWCPVRGRPANLKELSLLQLVDIASAAVNYFNEKTKK